MLTKSNIIDFCLHAYHTGCTIDELSGIDAENTNDDGDFDEEDDLSGDD